MERSEMEIISETYNEDQQSENDGSYLQSIAIEDSRSKPVSASDDDGKCCKATVLLADDNPFNLMPLRVILNETFNILCDLVENGLEEVEIFKSNQEKTCCDVKYKLVLTDLNMPEMDGFEASRQIISYQRQHTH